MPTSSASRIPDSDICAGRGPCRLPCRGVAATRRQHLSSGAIPDRKATWNSSVRTGHCAGTAAVRTATIRLRVSGGARDAPPGRRRAPERGRRGEQGAGDVEDPGTRRARSRVLDRCRRDVLVSSPPFRVVRRRGGAAARRPGRSARLRSHTGPRIRSTGSAHSWRSVGCPTGRRRRRTAGRARTP